MDLCLPLLHDESSPQGHALLPIMLFHGLSHAAHKTVLSSPSAGSHLNDLQW